MSLYNTHDFTRSLIRYIMNICEAFLFLIRSLFPFFKRLFTSILSIFDIVSDLVNSCDFLHHDSSVRTPNNICKGNSNLHENVSTVYLTNKTTLETWSKMCGFEYDSDQGFTIVNNETVQREVVNGLENFPCCLDERAESHIIWGCVGLSIMFLPGIMTLIMTCISKTKYEYLTMRHGSKSSRIRNLVNILMFPLTIIMFQVYGVFSGLNDEAQGFLAICVALEAFLESFLQIVLQMFTIFYGYDITTTQVITICASFLILSKASIDLDLEMYKHKLTLYDTLRHYLQMIPGYGSTIAFRALAFSVTLAFLRSWALIPMSLLMIELIVAYRLSFGSFGKIDGCKESPFVPLMLTNLGVTNVGMIGALEFLYHGKKEEGKWVNNYIKETNRFIKLSSTASYLHHGTVLSIILGLVLNDSNYFDHWRSTTFILNYYQGYHFEKASYIFVGTMGMGFVGLLSSLYLGARGMQIAIPDEEKDQKRTTYTI